MFVVGTENYSAVQMDPWLLSNYGVPLGKPTLAPPISPEMQAIDEKILRLGSGGNHASFNPTLVDLKRQRNAFTAIYRLPRDTLTTIFKYAISVNPRIITSTVSSRYATLQRIILVCHHWRSLALKATHLWAFPDFSSPRQAREMVWRSQGAPLKVEIDLRLEMESKTLAFHALNDISRVGAIRVAGNKSDMERFLSSSTQAAPITRSLELCCLQTCPFNPCLALPIPFLGDDAPMLTTLCLENCHIPWTSHLLANLTLLVVNWRPGDRSRGPFAIDFVEILKSMPKLQELDLRHFLRAGGSTKPSSHPIPLPHLRHIHLELKETLECITLFHMISFPESTTINIKFSSSVGSPRVKNIVVPLLSLIPRLLPRDSVKTFSIMDLDDQGSLVEVWTNADIERGSYSVMYLYPGTQRAIPRSRLSITLRWFNSRYPSQIEKVARELIPVLPLQDLRTLHLYAEKKRLPVQMVMDYCGPLPRLGRIELKSNCAHELVPLFGRPLPQASPSSPNPDAIAFPALRTIDLVNVAFEMKDPRSPTCKVKRSRPVRKLLKSLIDMVGRRQASGANHQISRIKLFDCIRLCTDDVQFLEQIVPNVDCNICYERQVLHWQRDPDFDSSDDSEVEGSPQECFGSSPTPRLDRTQNFAMASGSGNRGEWYIG